MASLSKTHRCQFILDPVQSLEDGLFLLRLWTSCARLHPQFYLAEKRRDAIPDVLGSEHQLAIGHLGEAMLAEPGNSRKVDFLCKVTLFPEIPVLHVADAKNVLDTARQLFPVCGLDLFLDCFVAVLNPQLDDAISVA